jgi:hypothetical protein
MQCTKVQSAPHCLVVANPAIMATSDSFILDFLVSACQAGPLCTLTWRDGDRINWGDAVYKSAVSPPPPPPPPPRNIRDSLTGDTEAERPVMCDSVLTGVQFTSVSYLCWVGGVCRDIYSVISL